MKKQILYEKICEDLLEKIYNEEYKAGMRVPTEKELSDLYHVSRITSKKALDKLSDQGIVKRISGKGTFVLNINLQEIKESTVQEQEETLIGLIVDGIGASFGWELLSGVEKECRSRKMQVVFHCTNGCQAEEAKAIHNMMAMGVQGIIIMCVQESNFNEAVLKCAIEKFPLVLIDRRQQGIPASFVGTDNRAAARELTGILLDKGYDKICFVSHKITDTSTISERQMGFMESHMEHGISTSENYWIRSLTSTISGKEETGRLEKDMQTIEDFVCDNHDVNAFFVIEYKLACVVEKVLRKLKLHKEIPVVCFDGIEDITNEVPFTHVKQDEYGIGRVSVSILEEEIKGNRDVQNVFVPYSIVNASADKE